MQSPIDIAALLKAALAEDIGSGDVTGNATIPASMQARFVMRARQDMVVCGLAFLPELFSMVEDYLACHPGFMPGSAEAVRSALKEIPSCDGMSVSVALHGCDGERVAAGTTLAMLSGNARALLAGERVALNLVQQLSGVATLTRKYVDAVAGTGATILDTRKTVLGMRAAQKYAVRCGGGSNHRMGLYDAVLIKDNHIAVAGGVSAAVRAARGYIDKRHAEFDSASISKSYSATKGGTMDPGIRRDDSKYSIEVECDTLAQLDEALAAGCDIVLLDNMSSAQLREAVATVKQHNATHAAAIAAGEMAHVRTEASGNVSLTTVRSIAETGIDYISVGKLTHSAVATDIGLDEA